MKIRKGSTLIFVFILLLLSGCGSNQSLPLTKEAPTAEPANQEGESRDIEATPLSEPMESADGFKYVINDDEVTIVGISHWTYFLDGIKIPYQIDGYPVTEIGEKAFYREYNISGELTIPSNVRRIGDYAFSDCSSLSGELHILPGVTYIGDYAFRSCGNLTGELFIPDSVEYIGEGAFYYCKGLTGSVEIRDYMTVGENAFFNTHINSSNITANSNFNSENSQENMTKASKENKISAISLEQLISSTGGTPQIAIKKSNGFYPLLRKNHDNTRTSDQMFHIAEDEYSDPIELDYSQGDQIVVVQKDPGLSWEDDIYTILDSCYTIPVFFYISSDKQWLEVKEKCEDWFDIPSYEYGELCEDTELLEYSGTPFGAISPEFLQGYKYFDGLIAGEKGERIVLKQAKGTTVIEAAYIANKKGYLTCGPQFTDREDTYVLGEFMPTTDGYGILSDANYYRLIPGWYLFNGYEIKVIN